MTFTPERSQAIRAGLVQTVAVRPDSHGRPLLIAGVAVAAAAIVAVIAVPALFPGQTPITAVPATPTAPVQPTPPVATPSVTPTPDATPGPDLAGLTVSTSGWKTFSSPEYPITFKYPADWKVSYGVPGPKADELTGAGTVDGCDLISCVAFVSPPGQSDVGDASVVLSRDGFEGGSVMTAPYPVTTRVATVPDLAVWGSADPAVPPSAATIVTRSTRGSCLGTCPPGVSSDFGPPYEYLLSTGDHGLNMAAGDPNPLLRHREAVFSFGTYGWGPKGRDVKTVVTILASSRVNPDFNPTQPAKGQDGRAKFWMNSVDAPSLRVSSKGWKTFDVPDGNIRLRVPPKWKVSVMPDDSDGTRSGVIWVTAPSGYIVDILTNGDAVVECQGVSEWAPSEKLGTLPGLTAPDADGVTRPVELWWADATWHPARVWLSLVRPSSVGVLCAQSTIDFGGKYPVYVGSADNSKNPTPAEFGQVAAMLASVERLK